MESLLSLTTRLREELLEADFNNISKVEYISNSNIHKIRKGIAQIDNDSVDKSKLDFLNNCLDFTSVLHHFESLSRDSFSEDFYSEVKYAFDPLCIYLMNNNYEVSIRKVNITDKTENHFPSLIDLMNNMEEAYYSNNYQSVTTLSSTILQGLFKEICELNSITYSKSEKFPSLYNKIKDTLNLDPQKYKDNDDLKKFSSKIQQVVLSINEIRNLYSSAHGLNQNEYFSYDNLPPHHIKLIIDSTKTVVNFFIESYDYQFKSLSI